VKRWIPEVQYHCPDIPIVLCGSKIDLREDKETIKRMEENGQKPITKEEGEFLAWASGCIGYVENSAITQQGLRNTFESVIRSYGAWSQKQKRNCKTQ
jgi:GTPase SAR1 family protein